MDRTLLLICIFSIIISICNGALHKYMGPRRQYKDRQKLMDLEYGEMLSSVENKKERDSDDGNPRIKLAATINETPTPSPVTFKSTKCTTDRAVTVKLGFTPASKEIENDRDGKGGGGEKGVKGDNGDNGGNGEKESKVQGGGSKDEVVTQNYSRPPGPNVLPDYYVDDQ